MRKENRIRTLLILLSLFCCLLECARIYQSGKITYIFLLWNLFLAWVPYVIGTYMTTTKQSNSPLAQWIVFLVWLLFFPNTTYLMSDLIHLHPQWPIPIWYDAFLLNAFAWNGLLLGLFSLQQAHMFLNQRLSLTWSWFGMVVVICLSGLGVYMGRYLRFNSWDVVANPFEMMQTIFKQLIHPFHFHTLWLFNAGFAALLLMSYGLFYFAVTTKSEIE
jgi:uncharacterized membrane protein